jgi:hypothetical protein
MSMALLNFGGEGRCVSFVSVRVRMRVKTSLVRATRVRVRASSCVML